MASETRRVGVVVPPDNAVAEVEVVRALEGRATVHAARFERAALLDMRGRLGSYNTHAASAVESLSGLGLSGILVACTGSSYLLGPAADDAHHATMSGLAGCPVRSAAQCVRAALSDLRARRITLLSPYPEWLTELSARYWNDSGSEVVAVRGLGGGRHPYALDRGDVAEALDCLLAEGVKGSDAVLVTGTGVETCAVLAGRRAGSPVPLLSSMTCGISWLGTLAPPIRRGSETDG